MDILEAMLTLRTFMVIAVEVNTKAFYLNAASACELRKVREMLMTLNEVSHIHVASRALH